MCHISCLDFGARVLKEKDIKGKSVIEVGSLNVNGSLRPIAESFGPVNYVGVDIQSGPGVDEICRAEDLIKRFGISKFDMVICTEFLEHVRDWKNVAHNLKQIIKPGGKILITTRSYGFVYHGFPFDFWRYEISDMERIFSDFKMEISEKDPYEPGVFILAAKPDKFVEDDLIGLDLYSIIIGKRCSVVRASIEWGILNLLFKISKPFMPYKPEIKDYIAQKIFASNSSISIFFNKVMNRLAKKLKR